MRYTAIMLALGVLGGGAVGCSDNDLVRPGDTAVGRYALVQVDGQPLPYTFRPAPVRVQVIGGSVRLHSDRTFEETVTFRSVNTDTGEELEETETRQGRWALEGGQLALVSAAPGMTYSNAAVADGTLSYTATGALTFDLILEREY